MDSIKYLAPSLFAAILLVAVPVTAAASDLNANPGNAAQDDQSRNLQSPPLTAKSLSDLLERAKLNQKPREVMGQASPAQRALSNKATVTPQQNLFPPNSLQGPNASDLTNKDAQTGQASKKLAPPVQ